MSRMNIRLVEDAPQVGRTARRPKHVFSLKTRPWQIQPFFIAPVMPGETMKNLMLSARLVTDPLKNKLAGWWSEHYVFYVKHRDLPPAASLALQAMHVTNASIAALNRGASSTELYTYAGGVDYVQLCLQRIVEDFFRTEEDGAWNAAPTMLGNLPMAHVNHITGLESVRDQTAAAINDHELPGEISEMPFGVAASFSDEYAMYEQMRALKLTTASFEDYLRQHGQKLPEQEEDESRPELVRYVRDFTYPTNTVEPTTGVPTSACVWSVASRADKDRYFKEPGFLFGVQVCRPKVFFDKQKGALVGAMNDAFSWLPAAAHDQGWTTLKQFAFADGPLGGVNAAGGYWLDVRDLFVYGDQYVNYAQTTADAIVTLPDAGFQIKYANAADADALFAAAAPANQIRSDGVVALSILGKIVNMT